MTVEDQLRRSSKVTAATVIVAVQAGLLALTGLVVWAVSAARRRRFVHRFWYDRMANHPGIAGLVFVLAAAGLVALAVGLARRRRWVPIPVYVVEGVMVVGSLVRLRPLRSVLGVALGVAVIVLVAMDRRLFVTARHDRGVPSAGGDADEIRADGGSHR
jgi:hypothetical protein